MVSSSNWLYTSRRVVILLGSLLYTSLFLFTGPTPAQEVVKFEQAPFNPEFVQYMQNLRTYGAQKMTTLDGRTLGLIPSPVDLSHIRGGISALVSKETISPLPASYDLRTANKLTSVKDQGTCGTCWAFATMGSLESNLLPPETWDFSENNLKNTSGFDWDPCDGGGNGFMSMAYLVRWSGPVYEMDDPYDVFSSVSPSGLTTQKHLQDVLIIPDRASPTDNESIKQAVMTYGAVQTSMYWAGSTATDSSYFNSTTHAYYYNGGANSNHAVDIVGWDDNYSSSNFSTIPPGNGAFIMRNSWGPIWGEGGYFYISYYDTVLGSSNYVFNDAETTTDFSQVYQYDPLGWIDSLGSGSNTDWFANIFTAVASEPLSAVSFYTASLDSVYEIYIYTDITSGPTTGTLAGSTIGSIPAVGYHTIALPTSVSLTSGQGFSIVVKLTTPGFNYPIPVEYPYDGYSSNATASAGQSYVSTDGSSWTDMTAVISNANVCLKAFTASAAPLSAITPTNATYTSTGGAGSIGVTTDPAYSWTAVSNAAWITITGGAGGTGDGTVSYSVAVNTGAARTGTIAVGNQTFTVNQDAAACIYTIIPTSATYDTSVGTGSVSVIVEDGCNWTAVSNDAWITVTGGASGSGNGTVSYSVAVNTGTARTGTIAIAGLTFTVNQSTSVSISLGDAVDNTSLVLTTGGSANWFGQTTTTHDGVDAAQSGEITENQSTWMETTVDGAGSGSFWWKVSSESGFDHLRFYIDGVQQVSGISGEVGWTQVNYAIVSAGAHTLTWTYSKDFIISSGSDAGWVDQVVWTPSGPPQYLTLLAGVPIPISRAAVASINGKAYVIGGFTGGPVGSFADSGAVQIYGLSTNTWSTGASKPTASSNANAAVINGKIYIPGGSQSTGTYLATLEIYDPETNTWSTGTSMPAARSGAGVETLNGKLYVIGGNNSSGVATGGGYVYDPSTGEWSTLASLNTARSYFGSGVANGKIFVFGGYGGGEFLKSTEIYDPAVNAWVTGGLLNTGRYDLGGASLGGKLYAFGGNTLDFWGAPYLQNIEVYDPATSTWSIDPLYLNLARQGARATAWGNSIYVIGGYNGTSTNTNEKYDSTGCSYVISPQTAAYTASGGSGSVGVTAGSGCAWTAASNNAWITVTGGASGTGSGTVNYSVAANTGAARTGTITIAGQTFTVNQDSGCTYSIDPTSAHLFASGGTGSVSVTAGSGCAWTGASNNAWITVTGGASGTGSGTVNYSVAVNTGAARNGTITIAGETFTVYQNAAGECTYSIIPTSVTHNSSGGAGTVSVTAGSGCAWTGVSNNAWITVTGGASGTGSGTVSYSVASNTGAARIGTITIAGETFTVYQAALPDGDLDGNGVSASDALRALRIAAELVTATSTDQIHGDVAPLHNGTPQPDGMIDIRDVAAILKRAVGLIIW